MDVVEEKILGVEINLCDLMKKKKFLWISKFFMVFIVLYCIWFLYDMVFSEV